MDEQAELTEGEELLTTRQTIAELGISRATLYKLMEENWIKPVPQKTMLEHPHLRFRRADVERLAANPPQRSKRLKSTE